MCSSCKQLYLIEEKHQKISCIRKFVVCIIFSLTVNLKILCLKMRTAMDNIIQFIGKILEEGLKVNILLDEFLCYVFI